MGKIGEMRTKWKKKVDTFVKKDPRMHKGLTDLKLGVDSGIGGYSLAKKPKRKVRKRKRKSKGRRKK